MAPKSRPYPKPSWMSHRHYWWLYKHDRDQLAELAERSTRPVEHDPLDDLSQALERD